MKNIGEFIRDIRLEKKLTQKAFGKLVGVDDKTVSKWEHNVYLPDITLLSPLSKALGITVDELLACERQEKTKLDIVNDQEESTIKPKPKSKLFFKILLIILTLSSISIASFIMYLKTNKAKSLDEPTSNEVNVYKLTSDDEDLIIEGYIIESGSEHLLVVKRLCVKNIYFKKGTDIEIKILSLNDEVILNKTINISNTLNEGNSINLSDIETQKVNSTRKINNNILKMRIKGITNNSKQKNSESEIKLIKIY